MKKIIVILLVASIYHSGWTQERTFRDVSVSIPYGEKQFSVALRANPTTGYTWKILRYDHLRVNFVSEHYQPRDVHLIGSPGIQYFTFNLTSRVSAPQCGVIRLTYTRSWEHQAGPVTNITWCYRAK